jgi:methylated-DNA-[protein]-cysteine S-methyltransferase
MKFFDTFSSPFGELYIIFSGKALAGISFKKPHMRMGNVPDSFKKQLAEYFEGKLKEFKQDIVLTEGTEFERRVWLALRNIPYGETRTYKWLAEKIGKPKGSRAVGQALSKNPIPIVLPCHRIIESDGDIGGYSSGVDIKRRLLEREYYYSINSKR